EMENSIRRIMAFVPFGRSDSGMSPYVEGKTIFQSNQGGYTQFNTGGYTSTSNPLGNNTAPMSPQQMDDFLTRIFEMRVKSVLSAAGGNPQTAVSSLISQGNIFTGRGDTSRLATLTRLTDLMPQEQQIGAIQG